MAVQQCSADLQSMFINSSVPEHTSMLDAWGKFPPAGIQGGNLQSWGAYWECHSLGLDVARYCGVQNAGFPLTGIKVTVNAQQPFVLPMYLTQLGICVPSSCNQDNLQDALNSSSGAVQIEAIGGHLVFYCDQPKPLSSSASAVIGLLIAFGVIGVVCSLVFEFKRFLKLAGHGGFKPDRKQPLLEEGEREEASAPGEEERQTLLTVGDHDSNRIAPDPEQPQQSHGKRKKRDDRSMSDKLIEAFAASENLRKLFTVSEGGNPQLSKLKALDGIRVMSLLWVILGHTYMNFTSTSQNLVALQDKLKDYSFLFVTNAFFSVDTFFFLSGFLACILLLLELEKGVRFDASKIGFVYLHRIWRILPTYLLVVLFLTFVMNFTGNGPAWTPINGVESQCKSVWWRDVLFINNFWSMNSDCVGWAWYLANDMQFFLLAPFLALALFKNARAGFSLLGALWLISVIYCLVVSMKYHYSAYMIGETTQGDEAHSFTNMIYIKPWARIQPYLIGMAAAYVHLKHGPKITANLTRRLLSVGAMLIALCLLCICIFSIRHEQAGGTWTNAGNGFYNALSRSVWGFGLAIIVIVCCNGGGSVVNDFLSASFWTPLARVGLSAYLIHYLFIIWAIGNSKVSLFFSDASVVTLFLGLVMLTYAFGFLVAAFVEAPTRNLDKIIFK
eukprot:TRINITY_DN23182_c0_g1_i1.p1 TRINITY_DN23182_c0_g1~~TRINITY_DN23182_c0_g1_i1.p1  ORF type:complete len:683 (-),score=171.21 TRINITY_DN23182_c0_g1_i1:92-2107(-)